MAKIREEKIKAILNSCLSDAGISCTNPTVNSFLEKLRKQIIKVEESHKDNDHHNVDNYLNTIIHIASAAKKFNKYFI